MHLFQVEFSRIPSTVGGIILIFIWSFRNLWKINWTLTAKNNNAIVQFRIISYLLRVPHIMWNASSGWLVRHQYLFAVDTNLRLGAIHEYRSQLGMYEKSGTKWDNTVEERRGTSPMRVTEGMGESSNWWKVWTVWMIPYTISHCYDNNWIVMVENLNKIIWILSLQ